MIGRTKLKFLEENTCPSTTLSTTNPICAALGLNAGLYDDVRSTLVLRKYMAQISVPTVTDIMFLAKGYSVLDT
jgi:hypothetical protein